MGQLSTIFRGKVGKLMEMLAYFYHPECLLCRCYDAQAAWGLCIGCWADLPWLDNNRCSCCAQKLVGIKNGDNLLCGECQISPPDFQKVTALFSYTYPIAEGIACFKYQRKHYDGRWLAKLLYDVILDKKQKLPQAIVPVPLHYKKLQQRGFNQAYELCYFFKQEICIETNLIIKNKSTLSQTKINKAQRGRQLKKAFYLNPKKKCDYKHVVIIDDVMTTGATARAVAQILKQVGVRIIEVWVVARV